jgi:hypothetical protein
MARMIGKPNRAIVESSQQSTSKEFAGLDA